MTETHTLSGWLKKYGFKWVEGKEQFMKGELTRGEAQIIIQGLEREGAVTDAY